MVLNWKDVTDIEEFKTIRHKSCIPHIRINRNKLILFSTDFVNQNKDIFESCNFVKLGFSQKANAIVIFFTDKKEKFKTLKITKINQYKSYFRWSFSVASFIKRFELNKKNVTLTGAYSIKKINHPNEKYCFAICLNEKYE